jgi:hypothetical protein
MSSRSQTVLKWRAKRLPFSIKFLARARVGTVEHALALGKELGAAQYNSSIPERMPRIFVFLEGTQKTFYRIAYPVFPAEDTFLRQLLKKLPVRCVKGREKTE